MVPERFTHSAKVCRREQSSFPTTISSLTDKRAGKKSEKELLPFFIAGHFAPSSMNGVGDHKDKSGPLFIYELSFLNFYCVWQQKWGQTRTMRTTAFILKMFVLCRDYINT